MQQSGIKRFFSQSTASTPASDGTAEAPPTSQKRYRPIEIDENDTNANVVPSDDQQVQHSLNLYKHRDVVTCGAGFSLRNTAVSSSQRFRASEERSHGFTVVCAG